MFVLDTSALSAADVACWRYFLHFATTQLSLNRDIRETESFIPDEKTEFAAIGSSQALSHRLLVNFETLYVIPRQPPLIIDAYLFQNLKSFYDPLLEVCLNQQGRIDVDESAVRDWLRNIKPAAPRACLISSVFSGDRFLEGFLENMAALEGYGRYEHFLIRAGSPGHEHELLLNHVRSYPGAVYINLKHDPGLYQVWNLGTQLATAPYLSNANIDDRRAPEQVSRLCDYLDQYPEAAAASSSLRVTEQLNLSWDHSADCPVLFNDVAAGVYSARALIRKSAAGYRSRNLPHCMPIWRRRLHAEYGEFNEKLFGPSADWEFWLRCGSQGESFYFLPEPLGLYLKHPDSYWRRQEDSTENRFDQAILQLYSQLSADAMCTDTSQLSPFSMEIQQARRLLSAHVCGAGVMTLLRVIKRGRLQGGTTQDLLRSLSLRYLGYGKIGELTTLSIWAGGYRGLIEVFIDLVHCIDFERLEDQARNRVGETLCMACQDWFEMSGERRWWLLWALLARKLQRPALESQLLKPFAESDPLWFWKNVQTVYRFRAPLSDLTRRLSQISVPEGDSETDLANLNLFYYPEYLTTNMYQRWLYSNVRDAGGFTVGIRDYSQLEQLQPEKKRENVFHLHWINAIFQGCCERNKFGHRANHFLATVRRLKERGFSFYWTIHNRLSHECVAPEEEFSFRRRLSQLADRVYLHHPLIAHELSWLDNSEKLYLVEHGPHEVSTAAQQSCQAARDKLGFEVDDFVLVHVGRMRDYKALHESLPVVLEVLREKPNMRLVLAGKVTSKELERQLDEANQPNLKVDDRLLPQDELETYMAAADFGFLSYRDILTSGALFHWLSCGKPVIGPELGSIPAYLIDGWNGYLYKDRYSLLAALEKAVSHDKEHILSMQNKALKVAQQLKWEFF